MAGSVPSVRVAVLVSGAGTILDAITDAGIDVAVVVADRPCRGLERAAAAGIPTELVARDRFDGAFDRDEYSARLAGVLSAHEVDLVAMAGFGTILSEPMHHAFGGRILNTHPALLPSFKGWHAVRDALAYGVKVTGCTVHVATLEVDAGPIVAQEAVSVLPGDTVDSLHERIKAVERRLYPDTVAAVVAGDHTLPPPEPEGP